MPNMVMSAKAMVKIVVFIVVIFFSGECLFVIFNVQSNGLFRGPYNEIDRGAAVIDEGRLIGNKRQIIDLQPVFTQFIGQKPDFIGYFWAIVDIKDCFAGEKR